MSSAIRYWYTLDTLSGGTVSVHARGPSMKLLKIQSSNTEATLQPVVSCNAVHCRFQQPLWPYFASLTALAAIRRASLADGPS
eukprot:4945965-Prymnesium_polylepis.1